VQVEGGAKAEGCEGSEGEPEVYGIDTSAAAQGEVREAQGGSCRKEAAGWSEQPNTAQWVHDCAPTVAVTVPGGS